MIGSEGLAATHTFVGVTDAVQTAGAWKRKAWGLAIALADEGHFSWEDLRQAMLTEPLQALETDGWSYCQRWLNAFTRVVQNAGLVDVGAIAQLNDWANRATAHETA